MFLVHSLPVAILFCVLTMLGWGSWANTQKLAGKEKWPFELFYWDYAIGVLLFGLLFAASLGSYGLRRPPALRQPDYGGIPVHPARSDQRRDLQCFEHSAGGGIDAAGLAVAFPVGVGLGARDRHPRQLPRAQGQSGAALRRSGRDRVRHGDVGDGAPRLPGARQQSGDGVVYSVLAGCIMGFFYPQLMHSVSPDFNSGTIQPGMLTPYVALVFFGVGVFVSNFLWNTIFMRAGQVTYGHYFQGSAKLHVIGILGGILWMVALSFNVLASGVAGPAISYALGQGATLVAAMWGLLIWREFRPRRAPGPTWC